jgi:hypothetical protein
MPILITYRIVDGFNQYNDYHIHQDGEDMTDDENLIKDVFGEKDEGDYREISVEAMKHISIKQAEFLRECHIAFPYGGNEWLRQLAKEERKNYETT